MPSPVRLDRLGGYATPVSPPRKDRRPLLALALGLLLPVALELGARLLWGSPPATTWAAQTGWAGCFFRDADDGSDRWGMCRAGGKPRKLQRWAHQSERPRVAVMGGSSVLQGKRVDWPLFTALLDEALPEAELMNMGAPGVNSAGVLARVRALQDRDVDALVVYSGHNDIAGLVFGGGGQALATARVRIWLEKSWLFAGLSRGMGQGAGLDPAGAALVQAKSLERDPPVFAPQHDSADVDRAVVEFEANLRAVVAAAGDRPVVLVTPISHPRWPALGTTEGPDLALTGDCETDLAATRAPQTALQAWRGVQAAAGCADDAALVDSAAQVTRLDSLPLRATPEINQAVRRVAAQTDAHLVDLEAVVPLAARASGKLHHDPVHLSARGHRVVAGAVVPVLEEVLEEVVGGVR